MGRARSSANRTAISKRKLINDTGRGPTRRWADAKTASCPRANRNNLWDMDALAQTGRAALLSLANVLLWRVSEPSRGIALAYRIAPGLPRRGCLGTVCEKDPLRPAPQISTAARLAQKNRRLAQQRRAAAQDHYQLTFNRLSRSARRFRQSHGKTPLSLERAQGEERLVMIGQTFRL